MNVPYAVSVEMEYLELLERLDWVLLLVNKIHRDSNEGILNSPNTVL
jgi:hypothetical protein